MKKGISEIEENPIRRFYDAVACEYAEKYFHEFDHKPFDRSILDRFAGLVRSRGRVCDMGCGPGEVARFLKDRAVDVFGLDMSERMLDEGRRLSPDIEFTSGDFLDLDLQDGALGGIAAFYAVVHLSMDRVRDAVREWYRVLAPGGVLLIAFHTGDSTIHLDEAFGKKVSADFVFLNPDRVREVLELTGFQIAEAHMREPYPEVEYASHRAYQMAIKPAFQAR
jgi:SAM-dependent methyltransferase